MTLPRPLCEASRRAAWLQAYWDGLAQGELRLPACSACGRWAWPASAGGPDCPGARYDWRAIGPEATVFTFTHVARPLLADVTEPYVTGLVVPDEAPEVRIPARLLARWAPIRIGGRVRLAFSGEGEASFPYFETEERS